MFTLFCLMFRPKNLIAQSQSGTGKTAAFVLSMLSRVDATKKFPQVLLHHSYLIDFTTSMFCASVQLVKELTDLMRYMQ